MLLTRRGLEPGCAGPGRLRGAVISKGGLAGRGFGERRTNSGSGVSRDVYYCDAKTRQP